MPRRLARPCNHPGCPNLAEPGKRFCTAHRGARRQADRDYRAKRTDVAEQAFYRSERWKRLRAWKLARDPLCEVCLKEGRTTPAAMVHHVTPVKAGGDPMAIDNLMSLCVSCHNRLHRQGASQ